MKIGLLLILFCSFASAQFSRGFNFQFVNINGELNIVCPSRTVKTICHGTHMEPWPYDSLMGPKVQQAISLQISASIDSNSEVRKLNVDYDGRIGSSDEINLGVSSLFERPLLRVGNNKIRYSLVNRRGDSLLDSEFVVVVNRAQARTCPKQMVQSAINADCEIPYSSCQQYFKDQKYCQQ
jgi:hypothetical protein